MSSLVLGLPNQALKAYTNSYVQNVLETIPFEKHGAVAALVAATETNVFPGGAIGVVFTIPTNYHAVFDALVEAGTADTIWKVYRNGVLICQFMNNIAAETVLIPSGFEFKEGETLRVTATSAAGGGNAIVDLRGRQELMRNELFSQVIG